MADFQHVESGYIALANAAGEGICRQVAEILAARARAAAPVKTGAYRASIHVETAQRKRMVVAKVVASDKKSMVIESRKGVLARALHG